MDDFGLRVEDVAIDGDPRAGLRGGRHPCREGGGRPTTRGSGRRRVRRGERRCVVKRYLPTVDCGESHRRITGHNRRKWVSPVLGPKPMASITRDDVEDVRDALDRALDAKTIRHGTARNVCSTLTGALKAAYAARDRSLRVHSSPLHFGILPPKRGDSRQRPWLYPNEWRALVECAAVPTEWRRLYAVAPYTGLRPNELRVLTWSDVDTKARQLSVSKAWDEQTKTAKPPKTTGDSARSLSSRPYFPCSKRSAARTTSSWRRSSRAARTATRASSAGTLRRPA